MSAPECPNDERLRAYVLGRLPDADAAPLDAHIIRCAGCQARLPGIAAAGEASDDILIKALRNAAPAEPAVPAAPPPGVPPGAPPELLTSTPPGRFTSAVLIHKGGQAALYRAWDQLLKRDVAIKWIDLDSGRGPARGPSTAERALREIRVILDHRHENLVRGLWIDLFPTGHRIIMEWLDGRDFQDWVADHKGALPIADACAAAGAAANGLAFAHAQGVVHRDIKPRNLFRTADGQVKVIDFGAARLPPTGDDVPSDARFSIGTPLYMSPEQFGDPLSVGPPSDVYALGCVLHFLLTGRPPYPAGSPYEAMKMHCQGEVPDPRAVRPDVPGPLAVLVRSMLAKAPGERPGLDAVRAALARYHDAPRPRDPDPQPPGPIPWKPLDAPRGRPFGWVLAVLAASAASALVGASCIRSGGTANLTAEGAAPGSGWSRAAPGDPGAKGPDGAKPKPIGAEPPPPKVPASQFEQLFNGRDLTGWDHDPATPGDGWEARDGVLRCERGGYGNLVFRREFRDFHLRAKVRTDPPGDGAIFFRARPVRGPNDTLIGYQAPIRAWDNTPLAIQTGDLYRFDDRGGMRFATTGEKRELPEWSDLEILAQGPKVTVYLNGKATVSEDNCAAAGGRLFLNHRTAGTTIEFAKIEVRPLSRDPAP